MARSKIRLDSAGIAAVLRSSEVTAEVEALGSKVRAAVGSPTASGKPIPVERRSRTASGGRLSSRPAVNITLAHPAGLAVEAKRGPLAKAASSVGLQVKRKGR
ncbi:hypothetical protein PBI_DRMANHATTAN_11 [Arthrobacter phage DrManhattan]|uniref:Uncharacterized protein n=2 Tax=Manhattanvirus drmanhattan TaxID=2734250 RepID=A0A3G2KFL6_9CAUD|nr:hypothetical protein HOU48_gp11 [Arthrobacter phage DrManhattan]AYN57731.1 hypothetical protein PBI_DRMANHATTAN_11 [Arthrobacter phage DrManhattan]QHB36593.1 hypothetical protein SEA_ADOLIN_11 [Arthrobacter phage Adolin]